MSSDDTQAGRQWQTKTTQTKQQMTKKTNETGEGGSYYKPVIMDSTSCIC